MRLIYLSLFIAFCLITAACAAIIINAPVGAPGGPPERVEPARQGRGASAAPSGRSAPSRGSEVSSHGPGTVLYL